MADTREQCWTPLPEGARVLPEHHGTAQMTLEVRIMCTDAEDALEALCEEETLELEGFEDFEEDWRTRAGIIW